jgi:hypothetical protein
MGDNQWRIINMSEPQYYKIKGLEVDDETNEHLYWNNDIGWVDFCSSDTFTKAEMWDLNLPMGGEWVEIKEAKTALLS